MTNKQLAELIAKLEDIANALDDAGHADPDRWRGDRQRQAAMMLTDAANELKEAQDPEQYK